MKSTWAFVLLGAIIGWCLGSPQHCKAADLEPKAESFECVTAIYWYMKRQGLEFKNWPVIIFTDSIKHRGFQGNGLVLLQPGQYCHALAHEIFHHWQWEQKGGAHLPYDVMLREVGAHRFEQTFQSHEGWGKDD